MRGIGEKFSANPVTGTGSLTIPLPMSPGRSGFAPSLALTYDSGAGHGPFGLGWSIGLPTVTRKTDKGLPSYDDDHESDVFILSGAEDLVPELDRAGQPVRRTRPIGTTTFEVTGYRPRVEGLFARIERWTVVSSAGDLPSGDTHWRSISRDGITSVFGKDRAERIADPAEPTRRVFSWLLSESFDPLGNAIAYQYVSEDAEGVDLTAAHEADRPADARIANRYLRSVRYGNVIPHPGTVSWDAAPELAAETWHFELVFDYGEHAPLSASGEPAGADGAWPAPIPIPAAGPGGSARAWPCRADPSSSYRAGFEVRAYRLCQRIMMFHHFPDEPDVGANCLVRSLGLTYRGTPGPTAPAGYLPGEPAGAVLTSVTLVGHRGTAADGYVSAAMPSLEFDYSQATVGTAVRELDAESLRNLPVGIDTPPYHWVDLDGESISGVLSEQAGGWFYTSNLGGGQFGPVRVAARQPSTPLGADGLGRAQLLDLAGDGRLDLVTFAGPAPGYFERASGTDDGCAVDGAAVDGGGADGWAAHRAFRSLPSLDWADPNLRFVDLNGDGHADVLVTEADAMTWYPSWGEDGFGPGTRLPLPPDEAAGPRLVFADGVGSVHLADMSGDGLSDLVRIRNGEVCYWPNLGYGRFGARVVMDGAPLFDRPDQFDPRRLRLADVDGTGPADLVYLGARGVDLYRNQMGNGWSAPARVPAFPPVDDLATVSVVDLLGRGTACLVWSSPLPGAAHRQVRYVELMQARPNLLVRVRNNLGAETAVSYASSTCFYLRDKAKGRPWATRLPFPVHVVEKVETFDRVSRNRFVTRYEYHHGHFDGVEREFRGFGRVDQFDTEHLAALAGDDVFSAGENDDLATRLPPVRTVNWFHTGAHAGQDRISTLFADEYYPAEELRGADPALAAAARGWLLDDTAPARRRTSATVGMAAAGGWEETAGGLSPEAERQARRALKGRPLRQEVYALDGSPGQPHPYTVVEHNYTVEVLAEPAGGRDGVFAVHPRETVTVSCERDPADPRVAHEVVLDVDAYGTVTHSVTVAYGRAVDDTALPARTRTVQRTTLVTETRTATTAAIDGAPAAVPDAYRAPVPYDVATYQLRGPGFDDAAPKLRRAWLLGALGGGGLGSGGLLAGARRDLLSRTLTRFAADDLGGVLDWGVQGARGLTHETYRLTLTREHLTTALSGRASAAVLASGGYVELTGAPGALVATPDAWWAPSGTVRYAPRGTTDGAAVLAFARAHFFLPCRFVDPFAAAAVTAGGPAALYTTEVGYDDYDLLPVEVVDAAGNVVTAGERDGADRPSGRPSVDYRTLTPTLVTDPNRNRTAVALDALGRVAAVAVLGKRAGPGVPASATTGDGLGSIATAPDLDGTTVEAFWADPLGRAAPAGTPAGTPAPPAGPDTSARALLGDATTRYVYDAGAYARTRDSGNIQPPGVATIVRELHAGDPALAASAATARGPVRVAFGYSDGLGREIQQKMPAEPAPATTPPPPGGPRDRWIRSGWVAFNNKGKPVRQYEPDFAATHHFEFGVTAGVSPLLCYDPLGRVIATLHPNHTYDKVTFGAWWQRIWDAGDTACLPPPADASPGAPSGNPADDPDIGGLVAGLPTSEYLPTWHQLRAAPAAEREAVFGDLADHEQQAAARAARYTATPTSAHLDPLGRPVLTVVHNHQPDYPETGSRDRSWDAVTWRDSYQRTYVVLDVPGNQLRVDDLVDGPGGARDRIVARYAYDLAGNQLAEHSMEAGSRWQLGDVAGAPLTVWEALDGGRQRQLATSYDRLRRPARVLLTDLDGTRTVARTSYGETAPNAVADNLRGQVWKTYDGAGVVTHSYDVKGNPASVGRELATTYRTVLDWEPPVGPVPEPGGPAWMATTVFDAMNRPTRRTYPDGTIVRYRYNEAGLLDGVTGRIPGEDADIEFVAGVDYNARGQRTLVRYGSGVVTEYGYEPDTFRLRTLHTARPRPRYGADRAVPPDRRADVQNLVYVYDPVGNITHIADRAQPTVFSLNTEIAAAADYVYDAAYRLVEAHGREHRALAADGSQHATSWNDEHRANLPRLADRQALGRYRERYTYDLAGNMTDLDHRATGMKKGGWHRTFAYEAPSQIPEEAKTARSNRLTATRVGTGPTVTFGYDAQGTMSLPWLTGWSWDYRDQLASSSRQYVTDPDAQPRTTYYAYDGGGERVRKVTDGYAAPDAEAKTVAERVYLGDFELYRTFDADGNVTLLRSTVHVMDGDQRVALVERRIEGTDDADAVVVRYQHTNHLGSATVELDRHGRLITYEEYYPYGCTALSFTEGGYLLKRYRYTTKERDEETGLSYHAARYYSPFLCCWTSADGSTRDGFNRYRYVRCRPTVLRDLNGAWSESGHHYTVKAIGLIAGHSPKVTQAGANFAQRPDEVVELDAAAAGIEEVRSNHELHVDRERKKEWSTNPADSLESFVVAGEARYESRATQQGLHSLTGRDAESERSRRASEVLRSKPGSARWGEALHAFGDSFSHVDLDNPKMMYGPPFGHAFHFHAPDMIEHRRKEYGDYVRQLFDILATQAGLGATEKRARVDLVELFIKRVTAAGSEAEQIATINWFVSMFPGAEGGAPWQPELHSPELNSSFQRNVTVPKELRDADLNESRARAHEWKIPVELR